MRAKNRGLVILLAVFFVGITMTSVLSGCDGGEVDVEPPEGFELFSGEDFDIADYSGDIVIMVFFRTTCSSCEEEFRDLVLAQSEFEDEGVQIIGMCKDTDASSSVPAFAAEFGVNFPIYDGTTSNIVKLYPVPAIPASYIFDKNGEEVNLRFGALTYEDILEEIEFAKEN